MRSSSALMPRKCMCAALAVMVVNKWALNVFPFPGSLMCLQFLSSAGVVRLLALCGQLECEPLVWAKARSFMLVPFFFGIAIFTNIKLLQAASVETAIVFRTIVPIFTSAADWIWMGRALPELHSACGLAVVVGGSLVYAATSSDGNGRGATSSSSHSRWSTCAARTQIRICCGARSISPRGTPPRCTPPRGTPPPHSVRRRSLSLFEQPTHARRVLGACPRPTGEARARYGAHGDLDACVL